VRQGDFLLGELRTVTVGEEHRREGSARAGWKKVVQEGLVHFFGRQAPGRLGKRGVGEPPAICLTAKIQRWVAEARKDFQQAFFAALMAFKMPCLEREAPVLSECEVEPRDRREAE